MKKIDIYKIDNITIKAGYLFLFLFIIYGYPELSELLSEGVLNYQKLPLIIFYGAGSAAMLSVGYHYRGIENRVNAVLKILTITSEVSLTDIIQSTGFTRVQIEQAIMVINSRLPYFYVINSGSDTISDGRLRTKMARVETCSGCGRPIKEDFPISQDEPPRCPGCGTPLTPDRWNALKKEAIDEIRSSTADPGAGIVPHNFSFPIFILLMIFFWPGGIVYYLIKKSNKIKGY